MRATVKRLHAKPRPSDKRNKRLASGALWAELSATSMSAKLPSTRFTEKHKLQWIASIENHLPSWRAGALWSRPIDAVEPAELLDFIKELQRKVPHTARKVRQRLDSEIASSCTPRDL